MRTTRFLLISRIRPVWQAVLMLVAAVGTAVACLGQDSRPAASPAFVPAIEGQDRVLAELARILREERFMLSDGAVQLTLETLLSDEQKQADGIRELGRRTLVLRPEQLSEQDRSQRDGLADNQDGITDRYRRLEKGMEAKAAAKPDSVYATLLGKSADAQLAQVMADAGKQVRGHQLNNALRSTNKVIEVLREMVALISQKAGSSEGMDESGNRTGFMAPSLLYKDAAEALAEFKWIGATADPLGHILRALHLMEQLTERQQKVAAAVKSLAPTKPNAADLAKEESDIRRQALQVGANLAILDPQIDRLIRKATSSIDQAMPGMEQGPLSGAVEPSALAAEQLADATGYLRKLWKDILARLKEYTQQTQLIAGAGGGVPHGMSAAQVKELQRLVMMLLRATAGLSRAIEAQTSLFERTQAVVAEADLPALRPDQESIARLIADEVVPYDATAGQLPKDALPPGLAESVSPVRDLLKDATDGISKAAAAMGKPDKVEAAKRENESLEAMSTALSLMIKALQRLLGQLSPSAITPSGGGAAGMALDPAGGARAAGGYIFALPSQQQESVRQSFSETFPRRYDRAIKLYYQSIAQDKESKPPR